MRMTGYTKLFGSIITSTIWREKNETRILWITMLALKNKAGVVEGSLPGLADMARLSLEDTAEALQTLRSPDPYSRTKEFEGRRIEDVDGGWLVLNHEKWRKKMSADERRDYLRLKQREHRARVNKSVNNRKQTSTESTHTYKDTNTEPPEEIYHAFPLKVGKPDAIRAIKRALTKISFDALLEKTKAFAAARNGELNFCPNPATWFNQERYNDDPETWKPKDNVSPSKLQVREMSAFEIEKRIAACNDKINELWKKAGGKTTDEIESVKKRKSELKAMLST